MIRHILVPLDGSEHAELALSFARYMAQATSARLSLLSVVHSYGQGLPSQLRMDQSSRVHIRNYLQPLRDQLGQSGLDVSTHVDFGDPADAIVDYARQEAVDMIVICARRGGCTLGTIASKVLEVSPCPVTVLNREPEAPDSRLAGADAATLRRTPFRGR